MSWHDINQKSNCVGGSLFRRLTLLWVPFLPPRTSFLLSHLTFLRLHNVQAVGAVSLLLTEEVHEVSFKVNAQNTFCFPLMIMRCPYLCSTMSPKITSINLHIHTCVQASTSSWALQWFLHWVKHRENLRWKAAVFIFLHGWPPSCHVLVLLCESSGLVFAAQSFRNCYDTGTGICLAGVLSTTGPGNKHPSSVVFICSGAQ